MKYIMFSSFWNPTELLLCQQILKEPESNVRFKLFVQGLAVRMLAFSQTTNN